MSQLASVSPGHVLVFVVALVFAVLGGLVAVFGLYLVVLAVAALFYRPPRPERDPSSRLVVLVPAHNEADLIARCIASLKAQDYPGSLHEVVVVADNCTDDTAGIARSAGAEVLVRTDPHARGKGRALRWAMDQLVARSDPPDGIVVVDADAVADPDFLRTIVVPMEAGAEVVQGESLLSGDGSSATALRAAAFLLVNRVRAAGRDVLHLPGVLAGNGMLFRRDLLVRHPWDAFTSAEDVEYWVELRLAGVRPAFAGGAILRSPAASDPGAAEQQRLRWEGGGLHVARARAPELLARALRERRPSLLESALGLTVPPLGLLAAFATVGTAAGTALVWVGALPMWSLAPWLVGLGAVPIYVLVGLPAGRAPASAYRAMVGAPALVTRKAVRVHRLFTFRADTWVRGERPSDGIDDERAAADTRSDQVRELETPPP